MKDWRDATVHARHPDIPQDPLPGLEVGEGSNRRRRRQRGPITVGHGTCPTCGQNDIPQVRAADKGMAWRQHFRRTIKGTPLRCPNSDEAVS